MGQVGGRKKKGEMSYYVLVKIKVLRKSDVRRRRILSDEPGVLRPWDYTFSLLAGVNL